MNRIKQRKLIAILAITLLSIGLVACEDGQFKKAARISSSVSQSIGMMQSINAEFYDAGMLTKQETLSFARALDQANTAVESFNEKASTLKALNPKNKAMLVVWLEELVLEMEELNQKGILHIKNEKLKARLTIVFSSIQAALAIGADILAEG